MARLFGSSKSLVAHARLSHKELITYWGQIICDGFNAIGEKASKRSLCSLSAFTRAGRQLWGQLVPRGGVD